MILASRAVCGASLLCALLLGSQATLGATPGAKYVTFDPPGSVATYADSINSRFVATGYYLDSSDRYHGFLRTRDGTIVSFDPAGGQTIPAGINNAGTIAGDYCDEANSASCDGAIFDSAIHGFVRAANGSITSFDPPQSIGTWVLGINNSGATTGYSLYDTNFDSHGFVRAANGAITNFDAPGAIRTAGASINSHGAVAGYYSTDPQVEHGFLRAPDGAITTFDAPGSSSTVA